MSTRSYASIVDAFLSTARVKKGRDALNLFQTQILVYAFEARENGRQGNFTGCIAWLRGYFGWSEAQVVDDLCCDLEKLKDLDFITIFKENSRKETRFILSEKGYAWVKENGK